MAIDTMTIGALRKQIAMKTVSQEVLPENMVSEATVAVHACFMDLVRESHGEAYLSDACDPITLVDGQKDYWLDDDVFQIIDDSFYYQQTPYWPVKIIDQRQIQALRNVTPTISGVPRVAAINGVSPLTAKLGVTFYPTPNGASAGKTLIYRKIARLPSLWDADDDTVLDRRFPPEWFHALIAGALTWMPQYLPQEDKMVWERKWSDYLQAARRYAWPVRGDSEQHERYRSNSGVRSLVPWPQLSTWPLSP